MSKKCIFCGTIVHNPIVNILVTYADESVQETRFNVTVCDDCAHEESVSSARPDHEYSRKMQIDVNQGFRTTENVIDKMRD